MNQINAAEHALFATAQTSILPSMTAPYIELSRRARSAMRPHFDPWRLRHDFDVRVKMRAVVESVS
jgi:hypothetical protein